MTIDFTKHTRTPQSHCTRCLTSFTAATSFEAKVPVPGSVTFCIKCGHLMVFGDDMKARDPTPEELGELKRSDGWPKFQLYQSVLRSQDWQRIVARQEGT